MSQVHCSYSLVLHSRVATRRNFLPSRQSNALLSLLGQLEFKSLSTGGASDESARCNVSFLKEQKPEKSVKPIDSRLVAAPTLVALIEHNCAALLIPAPFFRNVVATLLFHRLHRLSTLCFTCEYAHVICMFGINSRMWSVNRWRSFCFPEAKSVFTFHNSRFRFFSLGVPQCANRA